MWRSLWRSIDRFSLQYFKYIINELRGIKVVDRSNRELVIDILQSIVEIVTYGDRHDPLIFECFMEYQVMAEFVRILKINKNSRIEAPLLQYLSIMIQNLDSEQAIYYCFSNDFINNIITYQFKFDGGDLAPYYVSFLRAVSSKINRDTLCLLVRVEGDSVISFPLYSEALKFACRGEKMIQTAVRALTLNIYNVSDGMVYQFLANPPVSSYFSDLVLSLKDQCNRVDSIVHDKEKTDSSARKQKLNLETEKLLDDLYYLKDIICTRDSILERLVIQNLLKFLVFPALVALFQIKENNDFSYSPLTSLYLLNHLLRVIGGSSLSNHICGIILDPYGESTITERNQGDKSGVRNYDDSFLTYVSELESSSSSCSDSVEAENINGHGNVGLVTSQKHVDLPEDESNNVLTKRRGILAYVFSDNPILLLASLSLLLILAESKDLDDFLGRIIQTTVLSDIKIADSLLKVLANHIHLPMLCWQIGWVLQKVLPFQETKLGYSNSHSLFNTLYVQTQDHLQKELSGRWFDYMPDSLRKEWANCKRVLEESVRGKDPVFALELHICHESKDGGESSLAAWRRMTDAVKAFVILLQIKLLLFEEDSLDMHTLDFESPKSESGQAHVSDHSSASFGSEVALGSSFPCKIAFSNAGIRDIYVVPVATGTSGKLLLMEKHPFRGQRGIVIAMAPLPGLAPEIDKDHPTWLHLQIREFDPRFGVRKPGNGDAKKSNNAAPEGRWTLGFSNVEACNAAWSLILEETIKQRQFVEREIARMLGRYSFVDNPDTQGQ
ncbi:hypothetical protein MLD38_016097 [Melastoma candidum]|uniref:Uncharacterized protein n=1 Tax=Melastoma candidum TaxID=119954 RepID=A0ACB9RI20_9MYRT|nr:hypothetical protein MLD38_016097 [Melastoma candidum]